VDKIALFITSFVVGLSGAMMPGPLLTVTITESASRGFRAGPLLILGHGILELSLTVAFVFGLNQIFTFPAVKGAIGLIGGAVLLWMGQGIFREAYRRNFKINPTRMSNPASSPRKSLWKPVSTGAVVSLSNPYWILWWATVGASYIIISLKQGTLGLISFYTGHISSDLVWYSIVAGLIASGRKFFTNRLYRGILLFCGGFLIVFAFYFLYTGVKFLL